MGTLNIIELPTEVLQHILSQCDPRDVASISKTCRTAYSLIYHAGDQHLWRQLYLLYPFDNPEAGQARKADSKASGEPKQETHAGWVNYQRRLTDLLRAQRAANTSAPQTSEEEWDALQTFQSLLIGLPALEYMGDGLSRLSHNAQWLEETLSDGQALLKSSKPISPYDYDEAEGVKARLRCCLSFTLIRVLRSGSELSFKSKRVASRRYVYDLRHYSVKTRWGPFTVDNRINWVHVEHLMNVVWMNLVDYNLPNIRIPKIGAEAFRPHSSGGTFTAEDWAGVEGSWSRYICFMDYQDLMAINMALIAVSTEDGEDIRPNESMLADPSFREATRLLNVTLQIVEKSVVTGGVSELQDPPNPLNSLRPPLYFKGSSKESEGIIESTIKGCVYEEEDGSIRWRFVRESIYDNTPQWSSCGVQVGSVGSAIGVIGVWTTVSHSEDDPVGPFWMFKTGGQPSNPINDLMQS